MRPSHLGQVARSWPPLSARPRGGTFGPAALRRTAARTTEAVFLLSETFERGKPLVGEALKHIVVARARNDRGLVPHACRPDACAAGRGGAGRSHVNRGYPPPRRGRGADRPLRAAPASGSLGRNKSNCAARSRVTVRSAANVPRPDCRSARASSSARSHSAPTRGGDRRPASARRRTATSAGPHSSRARTSRRRVATRGDGSSTER